MFKYEIRIIGGTHVLWFTFLSFKTLDENLKKKKKLFDVGISE